MRMLHIRVGDNDESDVDGNAMCVEGLDMTETRNNIVYCSQGPMWGRYVVLQKGPTMRKERFFVSEIRVFALA